jgi:hypothetical protein
LDRADLAVDEQDVRVVQNRFLALRVSDEVRREVALVELHALDEVEIHAERVGLLDGDHTVLADLVDRIGDDIADLRIGGGDGGDLGDLGLVVDLFGLSLHGLDGRCHGSLDASLETQRARAGGDVAQALAHERLGQHRRGGGAVTGDVVGLGRNFLDELRTHVLEGVFELDLTSDGHAVVRDGRRTELLVEHDVAALRADRDLDRVGELVDARLERATSFVVELENLCHVKRSLPVGAPVSGRSRARREPQGSTGLRRRS